MSRMVETRPRIRQKIPDSRAQIASRLQLLQSQRLSSQSTRCFIPWELACSMVRERELCTLTPCHASFAGGKTFRF